MPGEQRDFNELHLNENHGFDIPPCKGGNNLMSTAYLARWSGPMNEGQTSPIQKHVQKVLFLPIKKNSTDNDHIKAAIMNHGGVSASFYWEDQYLMNGGYYYPSSGTATYGNHMITIAGWDDSHNVSEAPGPGAFLCKNSWGKAGMGMVISGYRTTTSSWEKRTLLSSRMPNRSPTMITSASTTPSGGLVPLDIAQYLHGVQTSSRQQQTSPSALLVSTRQIPARHTRSLSILTPVQISREVGLFGQPIRMSCNMPGSIPCPSLLSMSMPDRNSL